MASGVAATGMAIIAAAMLSPVAFAQGKPAKPAQADISGAWTFREYLKADVCPLSGEITFTRTPTRDRYTCSFQARNECPMADGRTEWQLVQQSCSATLKGDRVEIVSKVVKKLDAGPPDQKARLLAQGGYNADNFSLAIQAAGEEMVGRSYDGRVDATIRFSRKREKIS